MRSDGWQQVDQTARHITPAVLTVLLVALGQAPLQIPNAGPVFPSLTLIAVYYWCVQRPDLMPGWVVFCIGLLEDLLVADALGVTSLVLLAVYGAVAAQRRFFMSRSFLIIWSGFLVIGAAATLLSWILHSIVLGVAVGPAPAFFQYLTTIAAYPLLAWLFDQTQRVVMK